MKILVDMNLSPGWVDFLGNAGFLAVHWSDVGAPSATDAELIDWAAKNNHVIVTTDLDFGAILAATKVKRPSVVQLRSDILTPFAIGPVLVQTLHQAEQQLTEGALISVDAARARLRILPMADEK
jgi:predicted nuclease of predicted toxin-antitoxin system